MNPEHLLDSAISNWKLSITTVVIVFITYKLLKLSNRLKKYDEILKGIPTNTFFPKTIGFGTFKFANMNFSGASGNEDIRYNMYVGMGKGSYVKTTDNKYEKLPGQPLHGMSLMKIAPHEPPMLAITSCDASQYILRSKCNDFPHPAGRDFQS